MKQIIANDNAKVVQTVVQPTPAQDMIGIGPVKVTTDNAYLAGGIVCVLLVLGYIAKKMIDKRMS